MKTFEIRFKESAPNLIVVGGKTHKHDDFRRNVREESFGNLYLFAAWIIYMGNENAPALSPQIGEAAQAAGRSLHEAFRKKDKLGKWVIKLLSNPDEYFVKPEHAPMKFCEDVTVSFFDRNDDLSKQPERLRQIIERLAITPDAVLEKERLLNTSIVVRNKFGDPRFIISSSKSGFIRQNECIAILTENNFNRDIQLFWINAENAVVSLYPINNLENIENGKLITNVVGNFLQYPGGPAFPELKNKEWPECLQGYGTETCLILLGFSHIRVPKGITLKECISLEVAKHRRTFYLSEQVTFSEFTTNERDNTTCANGVLLNLSNPSVISPWEENLAKYLSSLLPMPRKNSFIQFINIPLRRNPGPSVLAQFHG